MKKDNSSFAARITNLTVAARYIKESIQCIRQGYAWSDKIILSLHFLKIPIFFFVSVFKKIELIEAENKYKKLWGNVTLKNKDGIFFCGKNIMTVYLLAEAYQDSFNDYMKLNEGVFLDVGAHIGKYTVRIGKMLKNNGKVVALEPEKYNFSLLNKNVHLNNLNNVVSINKGAFFRKDTLSFYVTGNDAEGEHSLLKRSNTFNETKVDVDTLDNIVSELQLNRVDLIKIDVEGVEAEVLKGAKGILEKYHPKCIIEAWNEEYLAKVVAELKPYRYEKYIQIDFDNYFFE